MLAVMAALVPCAAQAADSHATPSTFASLFSSAQGGDTVYMAAGSYGAFNGGSKSSVVTVKPEPGAAVSVAGGTFSGASNVTVQGVKYTQSVTVYGSNAITFDGDSFDNLGQSTNEGRLGWLNGSTGTVKNSHFGGNGGCSDGIQISGGGGGAPTVLIQGNEFVGIRQGGCTVHSDPIQLYGGTASVIGNYFHDDSTGIMTPDCNGTLTTVRDNVWVMDEYPWAIVGGGIRNATVTHNVAVGASLRFYSGNNNCGSSTGNTIRDNAAVIDAPSGNTVDHNQTVTFTGGSGLCGYVTASPKGTASDGTDIGLNSCGATTPPPADTTPPNTTITSAPADPSTSTSASIAFNSSETGSTFECKLDAGAYAACTSPKANSALAAGSHTVSVRATDAAGNTDATPSTWTWTIGTGADTTAPDTTIASGPASPTTSTSSSFGFTSTESGSTFTCRVDAAAYASCSSPKVNSGLSMGSHTFSVRAADAAGNTDATPASQTWMIQSAPPADSQPVAAYVYSPTAPATGQAVSFDASSATCADAPCTYSWADDGSDGSGGTQWPLGSGKTLSFTFQGTGVKNVRVTVTDADGDSDSTMKSITVSSAPPADTTAPDTTITSGPANSTTSTSASFAFTSTETGSSFTCKLDAGAYASCSSPKAYSALSIGSHTFSVRATDAAGNTDATPATRSFTVSTVTSTPQVLLGSSTVQSLPDSNSAGIAQAFQATASGSGSAVSLSVYVDSGSSAATMVAGIYTDANGHPGTLLTKGTRTGMTAGAWNKVTVPAATLTSAAKYWIALLGTGGTLVFRDGPGASTCHSEVSSSYSLTTLPSTWTTSASYAACPLSATASS